MLLTILFFISISIRANDSWKNQLQYEDDTNYYYLGISSPKYTKREALDDAYNVAISELIKENFGYKFNYLHEQSSSNESTQSVDQSLYYRNNVQINRVRVLKYEIEDNNGDFVAYKLIQYPKSEAKKEKTRLNSVKTKERSLESKLSPDDKNKKTSQIKVEYIYNPILKIEENTYTNYFPIHFEFIFKNKISFAWWGGIYSKDLGDGYYLKKTRSTFYMNYYLISHFRFQLGLGINALTERNKIIYNDITVYENDFSDIAPSITIKYWPTKNEDHGMGFYLNSTIVEDIGETTLGISYRF